MEVPTNLTRGSMGLDVSLHPHQQPSQQLQLRHQQQQHQHQPPQPQQLLPFSDIHPSLKQPSYKSPKPPPLPHLQQPMPLSPEQDDHPPPAAAASPWQRMKWTDTMVRLLIMVVFYVGDEGGGGDHPTGSSGDTAPTSGKAKKGGHDQQQQQQQKKGKWKSVSRAMMERGYNVSPQQCEDKFNDLNKRYKRVNDILGRGTACRVVENQALLESMDHLSPKAKEEARKLLNSKHLFFREMCAYHSSCAAAAAAAQQQPTAFAADATITHHTHCGAGDAPPFPPSQCVHPSNRAETPTTSLKLMNNTTGSVEREDDRDDEEDDDDDDYDRDEEEDDDEDERKGEFFVATTSSGTKRMRRSSPEVTVSASPPGMQQLRAELVGLAGTAEQQRDWVRRRAAELEERRVEYQRRAVELEKQRFKWLRFSRNKEREMELTKLDNERMRLESDRMLLMLRHKEIELLGGGGGGGGGVVSEATPPHVTAMFRQQQPPGSL